MYPSAPHGIPRRLYKRPHAAVHRLPSFSHTARLDPANVDAAAIHSASMDSRRAPSPIVFDLPAAAAAAAPPDPVEDELASKRARSKRFGTARAAAPAAPGRAGARDFGLIGKRRGARPRTGSGFCTGFDLHSAEERERRAKRSLRWKMATALPESPERELPRALPLPPRARTTPPLEAPRDPGGSEVLRLEAVHVHGVDAMSTKQIMARYVSYGPVRVEWLNDSSCNIILGDVFTAKRILAAASAPRDSDHAAEMDTPESERAWYVTWRDDVPSGDNRSSITLKVRAATEDDRRPEKPNPKSKWSRSLTTKRPKISGVRPARSAATSRRATALGERRGARLGTKRGAIAKARAKKITVMDLDQPLGS